MRKAIIVACAALLAGCAEDKPTQIVVSIATNLRVPTEMNSFHLAAAHSGKERFGHSYTLGDGSGQTRLPATIAFLGGKDPSEAVHVVARGRLAGKDVVVREARLPFVTGRILLLRLNLLRSCAYRARPCDKGKTCTARGCEDIDVDPKTLPDYDKDRALAGVDAGGDVLMRADAASVDAILPDAAADSAGVDSAADAGPADAKVDAKPDAPPPDSSLPDKAVPDVVRPDSRPPDLNVDAPCPGCDILGVCHADLKANPKNSCERCEVKTSPSTWTTYNRGSKCVDFVAGKGKGHKDGPAKDALFGDLTGIHLWKGTLYVTTRGAAPGTRVRTVNLATNTVDTLAGDGSEGFKDGLAVKEAQFHDPAGIVVETKTGKVYVADAENHRIRVILAGSVGTLAGNGTGATTSDAFTGPCLNGPGPLVIDESDATRGTVLYTTSVLSGNILVRELNLKTSKVTTVVSKAYKLASYIGDMVLWKKKLYLTAGHPSGGAHSQIDVVNLTTKKLTTLTGGGTKGHLDRVLAKALFNLPSGIAVEAASGALFVGDSANYVLRKIAGGFVSTVAGTVKKAGTANGPARSATLGWVTGIARDPSTGRIYFNARRQYLIRVYTP